MIRSLSEPVPGDPTGRGYAGEATPDASQHARPPATSDPDELPEYFGRAASAAAPRVDAEKASPLSADESDPAPDVLGVCLADVESRALEWLWKDYIPAGAITVLDGD